MAKMLRGLVGVVCILLLLSRFVGCSGSDQPSVVLYVSADDDIAQAVIAVFESETGIQVHVIGDDGAGESTGLVQRLMIEKDAPQADVFWSSEVFSTIELADAHVLEPYASPATEDWPYAFRCHDYRWYGFALRGRVIVYAPDRLADDELPQTWMELTRDYFKGRIVMADPHGGTTGGHLGAMKAYWDRAYQPGIYEAFIAGLAANETQMLAGGDAGVVHAVAYGEADLGMANTDDVWRAQARGMNVDLIHPRHSPDEGEGTGTLLIPNAVGRVAGGPNPEHAAMLIDFLLSKRVERLHAESVSRYVPIRSELAAEFEHLLGPDPLEIDYRRAAANRAVAVEVVLRELQSSW